MTDDCRLARLCAEALHVWGPEAQERMAIEELGELIVALMKSGRLVNGSTDDEVAEEVADVELVLFQLKMTRSLGPDVERWKKIKLDRLEKLLQEARQ
jgi:NTP pyrophosphatase (non-canonical NTP hydrolase)